MNNYKRALEITNGFNLFFDEYIKSDIINTNDLFMITDYCDNIVIPLLQSKATFNELKPEDSVGVRFLMPITNGRSVSALIAFIPDMNEFDVDSVEVYDEIGIPIWNKISNVWVDSMYKENKYRLRNNG